MSDKEKRIHVYEIECLPQLGQFSMLPKVNLLCEPFELSLLTDHFKHEQATLAKSASKPDAK
jgi:hypothetical protein